VSALLIGRIGWIVSVLRLVQQGEGLSGYEIPQSSSLLFIDIRSGDLAVYLLVITLLVAIVAAFYAPRFATKSREMVASVSLLTVVYSLIMIMLQILIQDLARLSINNFDETFIWPTTISVVIAGKPFRLVDSVPDPHYISLLVGVIVFLLVTLSPSRLKRLGRDVKVLVGKEE